MIPSLKPFMSRENLVLPKPPFLKVDRAANSPKCQGTIECTPNVRVPMVFIEFNLGILGENLPINTHYIRLI